MRVGRGNPRYFHSDVYVSFLFGSRSFNRKPLLNYKFAANSNAKSHRNVIRFLRPDASPPPKLPVLSPSKDERQNSRNNIKKDCDDDFFSIPLFLFFPSFFFVFWDDDHVPTVKNWIEIYCNRNNPSAGLS